MDFSKNTNTVINNMGVTSTCVTGISSILSAPNVGHTLQIDNTGTVMNNSESVLNNTDKQKKMTSDIKKELNKKYGLPKCYEPIIHIIEEMNELNKKLTKISNDKNLKTLAINDIKVDEVNGVLIIKFMDGDIQKAVRDIGEPLDFDTAILVCICKHLMSGQSNMYNAIKYINKFDRLLMMKDEMKKTIDKQVIDRKNRKLEKKKIREAKKREERIEEMKEAYIRATKQSMFSITSEIEVNKEDK